MSQEWVDLVRLGFEAVQRGDMAVSDGMTTPDLVLVQPPEVPDAKTYEGRDAIAEAMEDWPNQWEDFRMDLIEILDAGDEVAVSVTRHRGRGGERRNRDGLRGLLCATRPRRKAGADGDVFQARAGPRSCRAVGVGDGAEGVDVAFRAAPGPPLIPATAQVRPLGSAGGDDSLDGGVDVDRCSGGEGTDAAIDCEATTEVP